VCTCLIVVAVANATATPKATMSAIKANFGPIVRPPISILRPPRIWAAGASIKAPGNPALEQDRATRLTNANCNFRSFLTAQSRLKEKSLNPIGTDAYGTELMHLRRIERVPIKIVVILLLDLAFL
jgi:hypothetical protein